jgi:hypothetical protein
MKGHGDDGPDAGPEVLLPAEAPDEEIRQNTGEHLKPAIFIEQDDVLGDPFVPGPRPMPCKRRSVPQTVRAQVGLSGPVKKMAAAEAERGIRPFQFLEAVPANDLLPRLLEESLTDLTGGREEEELPELSQGGKPAGQERHQAFSSSFFCWQSMQ